MAPTALISLLSWDSPRYLENLLGDLAAHPPGSNYALIIVDQGSEPATRALIRAFAARRPQVSIRFLRNNIGYSAGHNLAYEIMRRKLAFDYFVTINNDVIFGRPGWLDTLVGAMEADHRLAVGGPFCDVVRPTAAAVGQDFTYICGAVAIIRARVALRLGLFDAAFTPAYFEDTDMCRRYEAFGFRQRQIEIPVSHGYLEDADPVNVAKKEYLAASYGDFYLENKRRLYNRWWLSLPKLSDESELPSVFPQLYVPGVAPRA